MSSQYKEKGSPKRRVGTGSHIERMRGSMQWNNEEEIFHRRLSQPDIESQYVLPLHPSRSSTPRALPSIQESRTLHTPTRYLPQNQAIITTDGEGTILLLNDIASLCFGINKSFVGKSLIHACLQEPFKSHIITLLERRKKQKHGCTQKVIVCGTIIPIHKGKEKDSPTKSVASLWLKEKATESGRKVYIWIFEEIYETTLSVYVDSDCKIQRVLGTLLTMYGYGEQEMVGKPVNCLVPALSKEQRDDNLEKIDRLKFFGSRSSQGVFFPAILSLNRHVALGNDDTATFVLKITSLPSISGVVTFCRSTGLVRQLNAVPAKYLFGYSVHGIVNTLNIKDLMPQVPTLLTRLKTATANHALCLTLLEEPIIYVYHRDQSRFAVEIEIKATQDLVSVWITYDRLNALSKHDAQQKTPPDKPKRPIVRPFRISSFGAVDEARRLFPTSLSKPQTVQHHPLDDYTILDVLGQGTYGTAKLAYRKDDPQQKKLVIKYIIKSKIIVDSWIRDRQLGSIPMEIHILRTLQKHPHRNCCSLITSMEDEDCYFVVMELLGDAMDLFDHIELHKHMAEAEIRSIFYQVASAVRHLHLNRIVHRDIKDENVILDQEGRVHLIDFGCATYYKKGRKLDTFTGTLEYCAPEVLQGKPYEGPQQDIWACGVLLFTLIYRENPFYNIEDILESQLRIPFVMSEDSMDLIQKMLNRNVEERIDIHQVLSHPWFLSIQDSHQ
ncbi:kinase-like domain-containing protein [Sporodiniella umbellata]|nr:kinase-like domain-containing protein [Sporodiniella umbellata]